MSELQDGYWLRGIRTPEDTNYIGIVKRIVFPATVEKVFHQIEDFPSYPKFFDDIEEIVVVRREKDTVHVRFKKKSPTVLVPDIRYVMLYAFDRSNKERWLIRYQLIEGNSATNTDGLIVLEPIDGGRTLLTAWDFFRANWGVVKTFAENRIWSESYRGHYRGDLAFKVHLESPELPLARVSEVVSATMERKPLHVEEPFERLVY